MKAGPELLHVLKKQDIPCSYGYLAKLQEECREGAKYNYNETGKKKRQCKHKEKKGCKSIENKLS